MNAKVIAVSNHKGGVGKTTTVCNVAAELGKMGKKVLVIDMDPQHNSSSDISKVEPNNVEVSVAELLIGHEELVHKAILQDTNIKNVSLIPSSKRLEVKVDKIKEEARPFEVLKAQIQPIIKEFDFILIDCPPSINILTSNALTAADYVIIPALSGSQYSVYGINDTLKHVTSKISKINPSIEILGVLLTQHDPRLVIAQIMQQELEEMGVGLIDVYIPSSTKVDQASSLKIPLYEHCPTNAARLAYLDLTKFIVKKSSEGV